MSSLAQAIEIYIRAKDENRPHLLSRAFAEKATVHMAVDTTAISFPPEIVGLKSIADVLVRQFGRNYDNVYTLCLSPPPDARCRFLCRWLVGMSDKQNGQVRVGGGLYDWYMSGERIEKLKIHIATMQTLDPRVTGPVMSWLSNLPYPWCSAEAAVESIPKIEELSIVLEHVIGLLPDPN